MTADAVEGKSGEVEKASEREAEASKVGKQPINITPQIEKTPEVVKTAGDKPIVQQTAPI
ncbi:hypothetical protein Hanom_Chr07g00605561 [Helianthus anomalus]